MRRRTIGILGAAGVVTLAVMVVLGYRAFAFRRMQTSMTHLREVGMLTENTPALRECLAQFLNPRRLSEVIGTCGVSIALPLTDGWGNQLIVLRQRTSVYFIAPGRDDHFSTALPSTPTNSCTWDDDMVYQVSTTDASSDFVFYPVAFPFHFEGIYRPCPSSNAWSLRGW